MTRKQLQNIDTPKGPATRAAQYRARRAAQRCLNDIIQGAIQRLPIPKRMRWGASREEFVRPVHWVVAMLGKDSDHGEVLGIATGNTTRGHRFHSSGKPLTSIRSITRPLLADAKVIASFDSASNDSRAGERASAPGSDRSDRPDLLDEVTGLVEWPVALTGSFEETLPGGAGGSADLLDEGTPEVLSPGG